MYVVKRSFHMKTLYHKMPRNQAHLLKKKVAFLSLKVVLLLLSIKTQSVVRRGCYMEKTNLKRKADVGYYTFVPKLRKSPKNHFRHI